MIWNWWRRSIDAGVAGEVLSNLSKWFLLPSCVTSEGVKLLRLSLQVGLLLWYGDEWLDGNRRRWVEDTHAAKGLLYELPCGSSPSIICGGGDTALCGALHVLRWIMRLWDYAEKHEVLVWCFMSPVVPVGRGRMISFVWVTTWWRVVIRNCGRLWMVKWWQNVKIFLAIHFIIQAVAPQLLETKSM